MASFNYPATDQANAVSGPVVATDNAIVRFNGTSGEIIQDSPGTSIDDDGDTTVKSLTATDFTATRVPTIDSNKKLVSSSVTPTELGHLSGVSSAIQTQLNTLTTNLASEVTNRAADVDAEETRALAAESTLQTNITTVSNALTAHESDTSTHGVGEIVGRTEAQTLTNKTLTSPVINSPTGIVKGDVGLGNVDNTSDATKNAAAVTLTNKTIDADDNTISDLTVSNLKAGVLDTDLSSVSGSDDTIPSAKATKAALDLKQAIVTIDNAAGTSGETVGSADERIRVYTNTTAQTIKLDNTFTQGVDTVTIINRGTHDLTITANDDSVICTVYRGGRNQILCVSTSPSTNTSWAVLNRITSPPIERSADFTISTNFGTIAAKFITVRRDGPVAWINGVIRYGTLQAGPAAFDLPSGMTIDSDAYPTHTNGTFLGIWTPLHDTSTTIFDGGQSGPIFCDPANDNNTIYFSLNSGAGGSEQYTRNNATDLLNSDHDAAITIDLKVYINEWEEFSG